MPRIASSKSSTLTLNEAQQKAVQHVDGPMLIVAGAGTGKTKVVTSRIVHLVQDIGIPASNILALTFTEKATEEMRERVDVMMPLGYDEVAIQTFHGFCERVLRERAHEIGIDPGYKLLNQVEQWILLKKNLYHLKLKYFRPLGNPSKFLGILINYFSKLKDEYISPEDYQKYAEALPESDDKADAENREKQLELAYAYRAYQDLLIANNAMDFGDLVYYTLQLFEKRASVLQEYQDRFQYMMVDEFQDTNYAQTRLVLTLARKSGNLVVVGDDDQSIYRWRGASLSNIVEFEKMFQNAEKVVLTENYRSRQEVLDASYALIQRNNPDRLEVRENISKKLVARSFPESSEKDIVQIWHCDHYTNEVKFVIDEIERLSREKELMLQNFAILARTNQQLKHFADELKLRKLPYQIRTTDGVFSLDEAKDLVSVLRVIGNTSDDIAMFRVLQMKIFGAAMEDIVSFYQEAKKFNVSIFDYLQKKKDASQATLLDHDAIFKVSDLMKELVAFSQGKKPIQILIEFLNRSGYMQELMREDDVESNERLQNLHRFGRFVEAFEKSEKDNSIVDLLAYIKLLEESEGGGYEDHSVPDFEAVQLLTVHSSKGLEYPYVFVVNAAQNRFPSTNRRDPLDIPDALSHEKIPLENVHVQEERRLMYVACTRAKEGLYLSYSDLYEGKKKWKPSVFVEEIKECDFVTVKDFVANVKESAPVTSISPFANIGRKATTLRKFSYSQFDTFKTCPLKYNYRYRVPISTPMHHAANFGISIHNTLHKFYDRLKRGEKASFEMMQKLYEDEWIAFGYENKPHQDVQKGRGLDMLRAYYDKNSVPSFVIPFALEKTFSVRVGEISIGGRIDRIDRLEDGTFEVIDYKTGTSKKDSDLDKDLQLSLYAWACRDSLKIPVSKLSLYFLEDQEKVSTSRSDADIEETKMEIAELAKGLQESEFEATPGFPCKFCEYRVICPEG